MTSPEDRKMFAPLRHREGVSPEAKLFTILTGFEGGTIAANLADTLVRGGFATGTRMLVTRRVAELLENLEEAGRVERVPDGRYRTIRPRPRT
jgi:hypothetical protein